ncbi:MAG TPA: tetratricopeptide repeat protein [Opitutaceae bacterium]
MQVRPSTSPFSLRSILFPLLIFGLVLVCYWPALHGGMLWDDPAHITRPDLRSWSGLGRIWIEPGATQQYYPVLFSAFWVEHRLWADATFGYHLLNVLLHGTSCCLLALLLRRLWSLKALQPVVPGAEWLASALFAVHPVCVESVAWMTEQKNTLSTVFYLFSAITYFRFAQSRSFASYIAATGLFLLAVGCKTPTATLPAALLVVLWWIHGKIDWRRDVLPLLPWFIAAATLGVFVSWFERKYIGAEGANFALTWFERSMLAGRAFWFYLGKMAWPAEIIFYYQRWDVPAEARHWIAWPIALAVVSVVLWALRRRTRGPLAGWLLYLGALVPFLGFLNAFYFNFSYVVDHSQYLAALNLIGAVASGFALRLSGLSVVLRRVCVGVYLSLILLMTLLSRQQSKLYQSNEKLARGTIAKNPDAWMAHQILATTLEKEPSGRDESIAEFREVIRLNPTYPDAHFGLGVQLAMASATKEEALSEYRQALALRPIYAEAHNNYGLELSRHPETLGEAIEHFEAALKTKPLFAEAHGNLADALARNPERLPEAMAHYEEALRINPDLAWVHCHYAFQLARIPGHFEDAQAQYLTALRLAPNYIDAHNGLAILYIMENRPEDARREWETVLRIDPRQESARRNLLRLQQEP